jgi:hypothetical protein
MGGRPFPDGDEPDGQHHGGADEEFASVVLDEDFVRGAQFHEPSAVERMVGAAEARAQAEAVLEEAAYEESNRAHDPHLYDDGEEDDPDRDYGPYGRYGGPPYRSRLNWHRPVALLLALVMGVGIVALAFTAVYRSSSPDRGEPSSPGGSTPTATSDASEPAASAAAR